ncbi:DsbA family protein [Mycobacterium kyorinense]|uniref:Disulfide bond formation protein DsbA n=1 Tax=Mycobacterium kyorinense TaxID=487514 RepID=A0A1X1YJV1_9MYCO|nr:DsbA family protein [Mycobacterium kyorinense]ORW11399.1 disulfide bond formation protein DsbA [Mycobacterium kyorinense]
MADVDLYLDPVCPFSWVTSRWLLDAAHPTDTPVTLRQMSLAVLNDGNDVGAQQQRMIDRSRRLGRLFAAVADRHGHDAFSRLYDAIGTRVHVRREEITPSMISETLADNGFDRLLSKALDDNTFDEAVRHLHQASQDALGGRAGSPIVVVDGHGFFGPVLTRIPSEQDGLRLLDAVLTAATVPGFAVLQRPYQGPPIITETGS